ncbi:MAG: glycosyltransferase [Gammaproteobacteria bacterium]|nr:glycosyltransferase [Gammaproteobacteria bacterium]
MRILLLTTSFPLCLGASSGVFVERLAQRLGHRSNLHVLAPATQVPPVLPTDKMYSLSTFTYAPVKWRILAQGNGGIPAALSVNPWLWLLVPSFIASMMVTCFWQARRADIIFANWSICGAVACVVGRLCGLPVVTTLRGADANRVEISLVHRLLIGLCLRLGGRVVAVSDDIAHRMEVMFPAMAGKVVMIPNGVDLVSPHDESGVAEENELTRLLMVGSLIPRKSVQTAFHALARLPAEFLLTVVGEGPEKRTLKTLAENLDIGGRVHFVGHVPPEQITDWLIKADLLVMTSRSEGRPNVVLEAMAAGLPVVGSDIPGIRELITPEVNGKLFPVGDSDALIDCLLPFRNRNFRLRLGEASRRLIIERGLTWENTAELYMKQFEHLIAESKC